MRLSYFTLGTSAICYGAGIVYGLAGLWMIALPLWAVAYALQLMGLRQRYVALRRAEHRRIYELQRRRHD